MLLKEEFKILSDCRHSSLAFILLLILMDFAIE